MNVPNDLPDELSGAAESPDPSTAVATDRGESGLPRLAYGIDETAIMLGVCEKTVRRLIQRGLLRPSRALRHLLIPKREIDRFLEATTPR